MSRGRSASKIPPPPKEPPLPILHAANSEDDSYAFNQKTKSLKAPGPATYNTSKSYTLPSASRATIGKEERFSSNFAGMFIRAESASEMQCRDSPGPIYSPGISTLPRAQTVSWGSKQANEQVARFKRDLQAASHADNVGPAAYAPRIDRIKPTATQVHFSRSDRFSSFGSAYAINNSPWGPGSGSASEGGPKGLAVSLEYVRPRSAAYSFGGGRSRPPRADDPDAPRPRPRTAFLTHSIRGGLARPATLESGIGPADYDTDQTAINKNLKSEGKNKFGSAPRFARPGLIFVSAEHAKADGNFHSPGPKYNSSIGSMTFQPRQPLTSMHWCP